MKLTTVNNIGAALAFKIGEAAKAGKIETAIQYISHAAVGCGLAAGTGGACGSGAVGAVAGELAGETVLKQLEKKTCFW